MKNDLRWVQRFKNYQRALQTLRDAVVLAEQRPLTPLEQLGLIQGFEFTHELAWNVLKDRRAMPGLLARKMPLGLPLKMI